jgi:hypothetical protein
MNDLALERHYRVKEVAQLWGYKDMTIRRLFENEPGVLRIGNDESCFRKRRITLSIPESVMVRVHQKMRSR